MMTSIQMDNKIFCFQESGSVVTACFISIHGHLIYMFHSSVLLHLSNKKYTQNWQLRDCEEKCSEFDKKKFIGSERQTSPLKQALGGFSAFWPLFSLLIKHVMKQRMTSLQHNSVA